MTPLDSPYQETLDRPTAYIKHVRVEVTRGAETVEVEPQFGYVTQDQRRSMRWDGSLTIPVSSGLIPTTPNDLLTPFGTQVSVWLGVILAAGVSDEVPYGVMDIDASQVQLANNDRSVTVPLVDLSQRIASYRFENPYEVAPSTDLADAINEIVQDRTGNDPALDPTGVTMARTRLFGLEPETDPWRELTDLAQGYGYRLWYDRTGNLVLDQPPVPDPSSSVPFAGRLTVAGSFEHRPANVVVARGEPAEDLTPVQAVAMDDDSSSPTYAGTGPGSSPYGRVTRYFASPLITTTGQAQLAARSILASEAAAAATWTVTKAYDPSVDPDDVLSVPLDDDNTLPLQVDAVTVNIEGDTLMECRALSTLEA